MFIQFSTSLEKSLGASRFIKANELKRFSLIEFLVHILSLFRHENERSDSAFEHGIERYILIILNSCGKILFKLFSTNACRIVLKLDKDDSFLNEVQIKSSDFSLIRFLSIFV